ncbi:putative pectin methylesterase [Terfezia boudieri ATCC MYA-4762]|uniref:Pectinesterase n=1 Tax=Terfezia boudieri ATCC MYA-4762 TaxID=1051890 RepID=A0A3N4M3V6_9PEZI|nr:putative pectin methylesterase [Terfezia boudieri ATCC MYA-4762]
MQYFSILYFLLSAAFYKAVEANSRTSPPRGALVVSKNAYPGQFSTIQAALNALSVTSTAAQVIFIYPGTYNEQVYIAPRAAQLTIYGYTTDTSSYTSNSVTISYGRSQDNTPKNDETGTVRAWAKGLKIYNVNIVNSRGIGSQAVALSAQADKQGYYGVKLQGYQDTLLAQNGKQIYAKSYIDGAVDFVFGQKARVWFHIIDIRIKGRGWVTANGRDSDSNNSYYLFNQCNIDRASGESLAAQSSFLGRPWRSYSRVVFQNTYMSNIINSLGWDTWPNFTPSTKKLFYREYGNWGPGATGNRARFAGKLSHAVAITSILGSDYTSWADTSYLY